MRLNEPNQYFRSILCLLSSTMHSSKKNCEKNCEKKKNWLKAEKRSLLYTDSFLIISAKLVFDKCVSTNQHNSKFTQNTKTVSAVDTKLEVKPFNHRLQKTQRKDLG